MHTEKNTFNNKLSPALDTKRELQLPVTGFGLGLQVHQAVHNKAPPETRLTGNGQVGTTAGYVSFVVREREGPLHVWAREGRGRNATREQH